MEPQNSRHSGRDPAFPPSDPPGGGGRGDLIYPATRAIVRDHVRERREGSTFQEIADEVGVVKHSVEKFLDGATPKSTWPRWERWYLVDRASRSTKEEADEVAALVMHYAMLPAFREDWAGASRELAEAIERMCASRRKPVPSWVETLKEAGEKGIMQPRPSVRGRKRATRRQSRKKADDSGE
jgi:hypothetical protein